MSSRILKDMHEVKTNVRTVINSMERDEIKKWLDVPDPSTNYNQALKRRQAGTGTHFLNSQVFKSWLQHKSSSLLWLYGKAGAGKTFLSASILEHVQKDLSDRDLEHVQKDVSDRDLDGVAFFFFDFRDTKKQSHTGFIRSLAYQLCLQNSTLWQKLVEAHMSNLMGGKQPADDAIEAIIEQSAPFFRQHW